MWVSSVRVRGLAGQPDDRVVFERVDRLGAAPGALLDAFRLLAAGLDRSRILEVTRALGWTFGLQELDAEAPGEAAIDRPHAVRAMLGEARADGRIRTGPAREITVEATIEVDPPLFGRLREAVLRDPQLAEGLGEGTLTVRVGWLFTPDLRRVSVDRLGVALGSAAVPLSDPAPWVDRVLTDLGSRIAVLGEEDVRRLAARLVEAVLHPDPEHRAAGHDALAALGAAPFPDGPVHVAQMDGDVFLALGPELRPWRWASPDASWHARLVDAVHLRRPDVLVVPRRFAPDVEAWLAARTQGDDADLEQVLLPGERA